MHKSIPRFNVLGVAVSAMNLHGATEAVLAALRAGSKGYVCVTNVHAVSEALKDPDYRRILNASFLTTADGMPLAWLAKYHVGGDVGRVYGPDLMLKVLEATRDTPYRHFLYGGAPGVAADLRARLEARFPGVTICGTYTPPFRELNDQETGELVALVNDMKPDIIWVGLGAPKQERFMAAWLPRLRTTLMFGVGAAFDFHTGRVRQAPRWMQRLGLEWLFRLSREPRRLAYRYLAYNPMFVFRIAGQLLGLRKYPIDDTRAA